MVIWHINAVVLCSVLPVGTVALSGGGEPHNSCFRAQYKDMFLTSQAYYARKQIQSQNQEHVPDNHVITLHCLVYKPSNFLQIIHPTTNRVSVNRD